MHSNMYSTIIPVLLFLNRECPFDIVREHRYNVYQQNVCESLLKNAKSLNIQSHKIIPV